MNVGNALSLLLRIMSGKSGVLTQRVRVCKAFVVRLSPAPLESIHNAVAS